MVGKVPLYKLSLRATIYYLIWPPLSILKYKGWIHSNHEILSSRRKPCVSRRRCRPHSSWPLASSRPAARSVASPLPQKCFAFPGTPGCLTWTAASRASHLLSPSPASCLNALKNLYCDSLASTYSLQNLCCQYPSLNKKITREGDFTLDKGLCPYHLFFYDPS